MIRAAHTAREMMEAYAAEPCDGATLVLRAGTWRPGNLDKVINSLGDRGAVIKCEPPSTEGAIAWARKRCTKRHGCEIDADAAAALVEAVGADLGRVDTELEKLATAAGGQGEPITVDLVRLLTGVSREEEFWSIQEKLLSGDAAAALAHLRELLDVSRHDPVPLTFSYVDLARKLHAASRSLADGASTGDIIRGLKLWGPTIDLILNAARKVSPAAAGALYDQAIRTDSAGKSGLGDPERNLEVLTTKFTDLLAPDRRR